MKYGIGGIVLECVAEEATRDDVAGVVHPATAAFREPDRDTEVPSVCLASGCRPLRPLREGEASLFRSPAPAAPAIIHCGQPGLGALEVLDSLWAECYRNALDVAEQAELSSIALPQLPVDLPVASLAHVARVACRSVLAVAPRLRHLTRIRFVLPHDIARRAHENELVALLPAHARLAR